jgi:hypothetical protein
MKKGMFKNGFAVGLIRLVFVPFEWTLGVVLNQPASPLLGTPAAVDCRNCGAPVDVNQTHCTYCRVSR